MIRLIDTHTHMADGAFRSPNEVGYDPIEYIDELDKYGISRVWISPVSALYAVGEFKQANKGLYDFTRHAPERFEGFCSVNPNYSDVRCLEEIRRCAEVYGFRGLKFHPWLQGFPMSLQRMDLIAELSVELGMVMIFHDGTPPYSSTLQVANLAERHPDAKVILGHAGIIEMYNDAIRAAKRYPNLYLSMCGPSISHLQRIVDNVPPEKLMFGTDFGFSRSSAALAYRVKMWDYVRMNEETRDQIYNKTALSLLPE